MEERGTGILDFLHSVVLTRGIAQITDSDFDDKSNYLSGLYGYCTQEVVNLLLTGVASGNVFDGVQSLDGLEIKGVRERSQIGFLSVLEKYNNYEVSGMNGGGAISTIYGYYHHH